MEELNKKIYLGDNVKVTPLRSLRSAQRDLALTLNLKESGKIRKRKQSHETSWQQQNEI